MIRALRTRAALLAELRGVEDDARRALVIAGQWRRERDELAAMVDALAESVWAQREHIDRLEGQR